MFTLKSISLLLVLTTLYHLTSTGFAQEDSCFSNPCMNNGTCTNSSGVVECNCTLPFTGELCEETEYPCLSNPCMNNGTCTNSSGVAECNCTSTFTGDYCDEPVEGGSGGCDETSCSNGGSCDEESGFCNCTDQWDGQFCDDPKCKVEDCMNGGSCDGSGSCACVDRWEGDFCNETRVCDDSPCNNGTCFPSDQNEPTCNCSATNLGGPICTFEICETGCFINNVTNETYCFESTFEGQTQFANLSCEDGTLFAGKPIASTTCGSNSTWEELVFLNCNTALDSLDEAEKINAIEVITSDPTSVTEEDVNSVVVAMGDVTTSNELSEENIDSLMTTTNNLLQATNDAARLSVQEQAGSILDALNAMGTNRNDALLYSKTDSEVVLISPSLGTPVPNSMVNGYRIKRQAGTKSFSQSEVLQKNERFTAANFQYNEEEANLDDSLYAEVMTDSPIFFQAFHDSDLLFKNVTDSVVMSVQTIDLQESDIVLELKFYLFEFEADLNSATNSRNETYFCSRWNVNSNSWDDSDDSCSVDRVETKDLYNYITCSCSKTGYFTITSRIVDDSGNTPNDPGEPVNSGLTDGEIAGIVIGSVLGAVLIIGGIVYCVKRNNKKSKVSTSKVSSAHHNVMHNSSDEDMEMADKRSTSSSEDGNKL